MTTELEKIISDTESDLSRQEEGAPPRRAKRPTKEELDKEIADVMEAAGA